LPHLLAPLQLHPGEEGGTRRRAGGARRQAGGERRWAVAAEADPPTPVVPVTVEAAPVGNEKVSKQPDLVTELHPR
jgi:hypothetical protein